MMGMDETKQNTIEDDEWEQKKLELMRKAEANS